MPCFSLFVTRTDKSQRMNNLVLLLVLTRGRSYKYVPRKYKRGSWGWGDCCQGLYSSGTVTRVLMGFSFNPRLSGDRSSGATQGGLSGLVGVEER